MMTSIDAQDITMETDNAFPRFFMSEISLSWVKKKEKNEEGFHGSKTPRHVYD